MLPTGIPVASAARSTLEAEGVDAVTMQFGAGAERITALAVYRLDADRDALLNAMAHERSLHDLSLKMRQ